MQKHYDKVPTQGSTNPVKSDGLHQQLATIGSKLGDLANLQTTEKSNLVGAINETINEVDVKAEAADLSLSDGDYNIVEFADGHIKTKNFNSKEFNAVKEKVNETAISSTSGSVDLSIEDENKYAIAQIIDGHVKTKNFDSRELPLIDEQKVDFSIEDEDKNAILQVKDGYIVTKNFDGYKIVQQLLQLGNESKDTIPSYYLNGYIEDKVKDINNVIRSSGEISDNFIFITDTHTLANHMNSPLLLKYLFTHTLCNKLIFGGDVCIAYPNVITAEDTILSCIELQRKIIASAIPYADVYSVRGNHDFNTMDDAGTDEDESLVFPSLDAANIIFATTEKNVFRNESNLSSSYYYFDNSARKIRYIILDDSDGQFAREQSNWIINNAILPLQDGWNIILVSHIKSFAYYGYSIDNIVNLIDAINNKTSVAINGDTFDFSNKNIKVFMHIAGHEHRDVQTYHNGVLHLITANDSHYNEYPYSPFNEDYASIGSRAKNTVSEQLFDFVNVDVTNNLVTCIRIGAGYNRLLHTNSIQLNVGESITLTTTINAVKYVSSNVEGNTRTSYGFNYSNDVISVDAGVVNGLKVGEAIVCAINAEGNKEFFSITIK